MREEKIFNDYGCEITKEDGKYFISYDSGEAAGSRTVKHEISEKNANLAMKSERDAYLVILNVQSR